MSKLKQFQSLLRHTDYDSLRTACLSYIHDVDTNCIIISGDGSGYTDADGAIFDVSHKGVRSVVYTSIGISDDYDEMFINAYMSIGDMRYRMTVHAFNNPFEGNHVVHSHEVRDISNIQNDIPF
jgi:hypothetical protein